MFFRSIKQPKRLECPNVRVPYSHNPEVPSILVEEEERIRRFWKEFFLERHMVLEVYDSEANFLKELPNIGHPVQFYFDQDFAYERGVGIRLASLVKNSPQRFSTSLVTAYPPILFRKEIQVGTLDSVLPKYPAIVFGENFFRTRMKIEFEDFGFYPVISECTDRLQKAIEPLTEQPHQKSYEKYWS